MSDDCRNDCVPPLSFPLRIQNRAGLDRINFRIGNYADIREALLRNLDKDPTLSAWTYRGADDPGIALLEGAAILGDILTFYQELYANEAYLRTAQWRESISDLVRLLGYRLSPGLGGQATFAFEVKGTTSVTVPENFPLKAEVTGLAKPADFETSEAVTAYPWLSRFNLFRPLLWPQVTPTTTEFYIETPDPLISPVALKQGDRLFIGDAVAGSPGRLANGEIVIVDSTRVLHKTTLIKIKGALTRLPDATSVVAYKIGRTYRHFGFNGPQVKIIPPARVTSASLSSGDPLPMMLTVPAMDVELSERTIPVHPAPVRVPPHTVPGLEITIPIVGNQHLIPSVKATSPARTNIFFIHPDPSLPGYSPSTSPILPGLPGSSTSPVTVTVPSQPVPVAESEVLVPATSVVVPASSTRRTPPPLSFTPPRPPPLQTSTTTDVPLPTEVSINFFRSLNGPANPSVSTLTIIEPNLDMKEFPLEMEVQDLPAGVPLIAQFTAYINASRTQKEERTVVRTVASVKPLSMTWGLLTSNTSLVTLNDSLETPPPTTYLYTDIREFQLHETLSPELTLKAAPQEDMSTAEGYDLLFYGTDGEAQSLKGRRLFFAPPGKEAFIASVTAVETEPSPALEPRARVRQITIDKSVNYVDFPNEKPLVIVYGNLADATQGKTQAEAAIGTGDSRQTFQTFKVPKAPLTYLISQGNTPPETPELQVFVNQRLWKLVPTFFDHLYDEEIYIVREDAAGDTWVQFGDGKTGARLPSGVKNVTAKYRTGTGVFGPLKPDKKVQGGARLSGLDKIQMPGVSAGGSAPEDGDNAREAAPPKFQSLGRLVSLADFESEALAISGVTRATSSWQIENNVPAVYITVLMESGREAEISAVEEVIAGYNLCRGPHRFPVIVREGRLLYVSVNVTYAIDPTFREDVVTAAIQQALGATNLPPAIDTQTTNAGTDRRALFTLRRRRFGEVEYAKRIAATVQNVAGVVWAEVNSFEALGEAFEPQFDPDGQPIDPATIALPATPTFNDKVSCDSLHILALHSSHLTIIATADASKGVCS
jgi:hypothetical protein